MRILVVDDKQSNANALARLLELRGEQATPVYSGEDAIDALQSDTPDLVLTDLKMDPIDGMEVLRAARAMTPPVEVIVYTAYGEIDLAVEAMQAGARDFLTKPVNIDQICARIEDLRDHPATEHDAPEAFIAESPASAELFDLLKRIAGVPSPVWLTGEIGSGREFVARSLHDFSASEDLFHVLDPRSVTMPEDGTVYIPSVDTLSMDEQRELAQRLNTVPDTVRLVLSSAPDPLQLLHEGKLASELYYGFAVLPAHVPGLRDRPEDILPLFDAALRGFAARYNRPQLETSRTVQKQLLAHSWPGNIRELRNVAERAVVLGEGALQIHVVRASSGGLPPLANGFNLAAFMEQQERRILVEALRQAKGDRSAAGKLLGVERNTLRYKLNKYGLLER